MSLLPDDFGKALWMQLTQRLRQEKVHCYNCGNCTSHVYHHQEVMGDQIIVRTILLDGGKGMGVGGERSLAKGGWGGLTT